MNWYFESKEPLYDFSHELQTIFLTKERNLKPLKMRKYVNIKLELTDKSKREVGGLIYMLQEYIDKNKGE